MSIDDRVLYNQAIEMLKYVVIYCFKRHIVLPFKWEKTQTKMEEKEGKSCEKLQKPGESRPDTMPTLM